jgi:hypothetical protein
MEALVVYSIVELLIVGWFIEFRPLRTFNSLGIDNILVFN